MKQHILYLLMPFFLFTSAARAVTNVYDVTVTSIQGEPVPLSEYRGKVLLIVNTASKCGFTKQYADLVNLQKTYKDKGVVVLGFPANNFGRQEPGTNEQIMEFCDTRFGVDFPLFAKVSVKGDDQAPLFAYLTAAENPDFTGNIRWNFEKFLVGPDGTLRRRFRSSTNPDSSTMHEALDLLLVERETP